MIGVLKVSDGFYLYFDSENEIAIRIRKDEARKLLNSGRCLFFDLQKIDRLMHDISDFLEFCDTEESKEEILLEEICGGDWV